MRECQRNLRSARSQWLLRGERMAQEPKWQPGEQRDRQMDGISLDVMRAATVRSGSCRIPSLQQSGPLLDQTEQPV